MLSTILSKQILTKSLSKQLLTKSNYSTFNSSFNISNYSNNLSNNKKILLSISGYLLASISIASIAERKNFSHLFKQLGQW